MLLKVLQEVCHSLVTFKVVEVVVDPEQNNPRNLLEESSSVNSLYTGWGASCWPAQYYAHDHTHTVSRRLSTWNQSSSFLPTSMGLDRKVL